MYRDDIDGGEDESFGPGTDLVISLFAMLLILVVFWWYFEQSSSQAEAYLRQLQQQEEEQEPRTQREQLYIFVEGAQKAPHFGKNDAVLTPEARAELDTEVRDLERALRSGEYNQLQIIGHASPESTREGVADRERWNLTLSLDRAGAVADHLYSHGIPYECMSVAGFGRSQSAALKAWLDRHPGSSVNDWDEWGQYSPDVEQNLLTRERRVEIWGLWQSTSRCGLAPEPR